jgi:hypothetical protein
MNTSVRVLPGSERIEIDHSFIPVPGGNSTLFSGWGPRL